MKTTALYPGSFDPMTTGHLNIAERASLLFDTVIIAIGRNSDKSCKCTDDERLSNVKRATRHLHNVQTVLYDTLTTDLCRSLGAKVIIRGIRSVSDCEYERNIAEINKLVAPDIETLCMFADNRYAGISSTMVRELQRYGKDVSSFLA